VVRSFASRSVLLHILAAILLSLLVFFLFLQGLDMLTKHGQYLRVPNVKGKKMSEAIQLLESKGFEVMVQDSVYHDSLPPLQVMKQFPDPEATVKVNRTVYLTVNRMTAPMIPMPNLMGMTFRNAELELRMRGLKLGDTTYVPDIAKNAVKDQLVGGMTVRAGIPVPMGTRISLVLGAGIGDEDMSVPDLMGMTYMEAVALLEAYGINLGVVLPDPDVVDTAAAFVYWQNPERYTPEKSLNRIRVGQMMDIKLSTLKPETGLPEDAEKKKPEDDGEGL
jgi:beta-lactam-binding protein with PASTA domain